ncbi:HET domain-containing protein, partial [Colletotrichum musicola]
MTENRYMIFGTIKFSDLVWTDGTSPDPIYNAAGLPNLCAVCHDVLGSESHLREAISEDGFHLRLSLTELRASAETAGCRLCAISLRAALYSCAGDPAFAAWPVSRFLDAHGALEVRLRVHAHLRPIEKRRSVRDIYKLGVYGAIVGGKIQTWGLDDTLPFEFRVYALEGDDEVKAYISLEEYDRDFDSDSAVSKIRSWMAACDEHHSLCSRRPGSGPLPTRVLDVSNPAMLRLRDIDGDDCRYAALSYCWGRGGGQVKTNNSSLEAAYSAIDPSFLPLAIQDAVKVTRQIGLACLWVDALCIVQDSPGDMEKEMGKMGHIYRNAAVTIMAANASHSGQSFLAPEGPPRRLEQLRSPTSRFRLPMIFPDSAVRNISAEYPASGGSGSSEPLDQRAWAFQESILSRRAIVYGTSTLTWRCEEAVEGWNSWVRGHHDFIARNIRLDRRGGGKLYRNVWREVVRFYSPRKLTFPEDKLPAVSGLASEVRRLSAEEGDDPGRYLAGLWENDLLMQLVWFTNPGSSRDVRGKDGPLWAPSWSWASVDCHVIPGHDEAARPAGTETDILGCKTELRSEMLPMGQVVIGRLRVRGCLVAGSLVPRPETWLAGTFAGRSEVVLKMDCYGAGDANAVAEA